MKFLRCPMCASCMRFLPPNLLFLFSSRDTAWSRFVSEASSTSWGKSISRSEVSHRQIKYRSEKKLTFSVAQIEATVKTMGDFYVSFPPQYLFAQTNCQLFDFFYSKQKNENKSVF